MDFKNINEKVKAIKSGKFSATENTKYYLDKINSTNKKLNILLHINDNAISEANAIDKKIKAGNAGKLAGICFALKACINTIGMPISCGSKTLENYIGTYDADVVAKLKAEDAIVIGIANMDEFASGISGETSAFGPTLNPKNNDVVPGGSSSGSAASVAADFCDFALGTDTGGSVRNPASHCGVIGIKPSYGRVSRFGLIDLAMSFDQIGVLTKNTTDAAIVMEIMAGLSENDPTTDNKAVQKYSKFDIKNLKIGFFEDSKKLTKDERIYNLVKEKADKLATTLGNKMKKVSLKYLNLAVQTYYPIVYTEFYSGTRKFDGRKYGLKIEDSCGTEVLRRILGGKEISRAEHSGAYYKKALAVKDLVAKDFKTAFNDVDIILLPVTPSLPNKIGENLMESDPEAGYAFDAFTTPANLAGICGASIPCGEIDGIPVGIQVLAPAFREDILFSALEKIEKLK